LNDSKGELGSHFDRHENIGQGSIGLDGFRGFVNDARWAKVPGYLETPLDSDDYAAYVRDLASLRSLAGTDGAAPGAPRTPKRGAARSSTPK